jgi:hypothetical protein
MEGWRDGGMEMEGRRDGCRDVGISELGERSCAYLHL